MLSTVWRFSRRLALCMSPALFILGCQSPPPAAVFGQAAASPGAEGISRKQAVAGDPLRGRLVCWDRAGRLTATWRLIAADGTSTNLPRLNPGFASDVNFCGEVQIPAGTRPGRYRVASGPVEWPVDVITLPKRKAPQVFNPGAELATVQKALSSNYDVRLNPGVYSWASPLGLPFGCTVTGPGAIIRYSGPPPIGDPSNTAATTGGEWAVLDGLTFDMGPFRSATTPSTAPNLTLVGCKLIDAVLNYPGLGVWCERCEFDGSGAFASAGLYRFCNFHDTRVGGAFSCWAADHNLAMIGNVFSRPDRGPIFQVHWGHIQGCLFVGTEVYDPRSDNGRESFLCEPGDSAFGFHDNIVLRSTLRCGAGGGAAIQWDGWATGNLVRSYKVSGGWGFVVWGDQCTGNTFEDLELRDGAAITLGAGSTGNTFRRVAVVNFQPGSWNNDGVVLEWLADRTSAIWWQRTVGANAFEDVAFVIAPQFRIQKAGGPLKFTRCTLNGQPAAAVPVVLPD